MFGWYLRAVQVWPGYASRRDLAEVFGMALVNQHESCDASRITRCELQSHGGVLVVSRAAIYGMPKILHVAIDCLSQQQCFYFLLLAAKYGQLESVKLLVERVSPNISDESD